MSTEINQPIAAIFGMPNPDNDRDQWVVGIGGVEEIKHQVGAEGVGWYVVSHTLGHVICKLNARYVSEVEYLR